MNIIAIDPGFDRLGCAILSEENGKIKVIETSCISSPKENFHDRIHIVVKQVQKIISKHQPKVMCMESLFFSKNKKTATGVSEIRGAIIAQAKESGMETKDYRPNEIKLAVTGYGAASKDQVMSAVDLILGTKKRDITDDEYDAIAIGITYLSDNRHTMNT